MNPVSMTERLIDAAVAYERSAGADAKPARAELFKARAAIERALESAADETRSN